ncbi:RNA-binding protein with multiple splicing 2-like [Chiloscyllium punctatum]|uniref:RNA-binding protein with multiple splicing 2-like n=1 Tax=Chiloscyllium punctatum TaxID=137246 RepID=UPI003B63A3F4
MSEISSKSILPKQLTIIKCATHVIDNKDTGNARADQATKNAVTAQFYCPLNQQVLNRLSASNRWAKRGNARILSAANIVSNTSPFTAPPAQRRVTQQIQSASQSPPQTDEADSEEVHVLSINSLPMNIKSRELYLLFPSFKEYAGSLVKLTSKQPVGFVTLDSSAEAVKNALNSILFDPENPQTLWVEFVKVNKMIAKSKLTATPNPTDMHPALGAHFIAHDPYDRAGTALIPACPEAWAPYCLYTTELAPAISHTAFTYPAAALHTQMCWCHPSEASPQGWKSHQLSI